MLVCSEFPAVHFLRNELGTRWKMTHSHLICALISENEGLEKSSPASNLRKISVPANLNFFSVHLSFFSGLWYKSEKKTQVTN